jgi:hypothetical protein
VGVKKEKSSSILLYERRTNGLSKMTSSPFEKGEREGFLKQVYKPSPPAERGK